MRLVKARVQGYRSIIDTGYFDVEMDKTIEIYDVTRQGALKDYLINATIRDCKTPRITNLISY